MSQNYPSKGIPDCGGRLQILIGKGTGDTACMEISLIWGVISAGTLHAKYKMFSCTASSTSTLASVSNEIIMMTTTGWEQNIGGPKVLNMIQNSTLGQCFILPSKEYKETGIPASRDNIWLLKVSADVLNKTSDTFVKHGSLFFNERKSINFKQISSSLRLQGRVFLFLAPDFSIRTRRMRFNTHFDYTQKRGRTVVPYWHVYDLAPEAQWRSQTVRYSTEVRLTVTIQGKWTGCWLLWGIDINNELEITARSVVWAPVFLVYDTDGHDTAHNDARRFYRSGVLFIFTALHIALWKSFCWYCIRWEKRSRYRVSHCHVVYRYRIRHEVRPWEIVRKH